MSPVPEANASACRKLTKALNQFEHSLRNFDEQVTWPKQSKARRLRTRLEISLDKFRTLLHDEHYAAQGRTLIEVSSCESRQR